MKTSFLFLVGFIAITISSCTTLYQTNVGYDDVYYNPKHEQTQEPVSDYNYQSTPASNTDLEQNTESGTTINNYYGDYNESSYESRIRRFNYSTPNVSYYSYYDPFFYNDYYSPFYNNGWSWSIGYNWGYSYYNPYTHYHPYRYNRYNYGFYNGYNDAHYNNSGYTRSGVKKGTGPRYSTGSNTRSGSRDARKSYNTKSTPTRNNSTAQPRNSQRPVYTTPRTNNRPAVTKPRSSRPSSTYQKPRSSNTNRSSGSYNKGNSGRSGSGNSNPRGSGSKSSGSNTKRPR